MTSIWIDIENAAGTRYGGGPITTAVEWVSTRRLDSAGTFSFSMPASDPRLLCSDGTALLQNKRVARCWIADANGISERGAGIIDTIEIVPDPNGATMLRVSGDDLLRELATRTVGDLELFEEVAYPHPATKIKIEPGGSGYMTLPATISLDTSPNFLFVQYAAPFSKITFALGTKNTKPSSSLSVQFYTTVGGAKWVEVTGLVNGTVSSGKPFAKDGDVTFDAPQGWTIDGGVYSIRFSDQQVNLDTFTITAISVSAIEPVTDGLQRIMDLAPGGWSLDPAGMPATWDLATNTAKSVYMQFAGESVLAALVLLAEQTGEHFTLSASARRVWWIGEAQESSGLRAVQGTATTGNTVLIADLSRTVDSYELYTRAYAYGGGVGKGRLTMEHATHSNSGYVLGVDGTYLEATAAVAEYGRIDKREDYPDITPADASSTQIINAANTLYDRVYEALRRKSQLQYAYTLSVVPNQYQIWPGQTIHVDYHEWVEAFHSVNVDADLWVLEVAQSISAAGVQIVGLTVATIDYWMTNDYREVAKMMGKMQTERSVEIPEAGYSSIGSGVPTYLAVQNGMVTSIGRTTTVGDGAYPPGGQYIAELTVKNGLIVNIICADFGP